MAITGLVLVGFQNCAEYKFQEDSASPRSALFLGSVGQDELVYIQEEENVASPTPPVNAPSSEIPSVQDQIVVSDQDANDQYQDAFIECHIPSNQKFVTLGKIFDSGSNSVNSRVCMSEEACLTLVNSYLAARDCQFDGLKGSGGSDRQCTQVFPGSKGTCRNAVLVDDQKIVQIIAEMEK